MKKTLIYLLAFGGIAVTSCDKVDFPNVPKVVVNAACDTAFTFSSVSSATRNVLVEDFTGHTCGNCPGAAHQLDLLHGTYGDQIVAVSIHPNTSFNQVASGSGKYETDWRTEEAEQIFTEFNMPSSLPRLMINRVQSTPPFYFFNANQLASEIPSRVGQQANFSIQAEGALLNDRTICAKVEVEILADLTGDYSLLNYLVEDSITDWQTVYPGIHPNYDTGASSDSYNNYVHRHVLRDVFGHFGINEGGTAGTGSIWGTEINGALTTGQKKQFVLSLPPISSNWDEHHLSIVSFVYDRNTREVLQVLNTHL